MAQGAVTRTALVGLGANLEDPAGAIRRALGELAGTPGLTLSAVSSLYLTEPQGGPSGQNWYHNAAAALETALAPEAILEILLAVEAGLGRRRLERWGPRIIDLDLLAVGDLEAEREGLSLPHPRLAERLFVLAPLAEIAPGWRHPRLGRTAEELLAALEDSGQGIEKLAGQKAMTF